jgi:hypothetical protein
LEPPSPGKQQDNGEKKFLERGEKEGLIKFLKRKTYIYRGSVINASLGHAYLRIEATAFNSMAVMHARELSRNEHQQVSF